MRSAACGTRRYREVIRFELPIAACLWLGVADDQPPAQRKGLKDALDNLLRDRGVAKDRHISADNQVERTRPGRDRLVARLSKIGAGEGDLAADGAAETAAFALLLKKRARRLGHFAKCPLAIQRLGSARKKGG